jgi:NAD(P)-dependent dehydrogenase (short-subunit alcohol dehydrogenase family)
MSANSVNMQGRTALITGANSGIGKVMALELARMGATVVMVCRSKERGEAARKDIVNQTGNESVELMS